MGNEEIKIKILAFIKGHKLTVISTVDVGGDKPESAVIAFAEKDTLELIFGTSTKSRKYQNLQKNKNVSFVIGWSDELGTVQYEGVAQELMEEEAAEHGKMIADKNQNAEKFLTRPDQRYFLVQPTWIRLLDKSKDPDEVHEIIL
ncbi:pyridoxamine 5'-phosphate oxidase family protein [Candidatus Parcubacteria bacterium]|nr:pyridoxamine 5'-phosphate oxidase family protein [Candidatus Parcubacteria bacterium]